MSWLVKTPVPENALTHYSQLKVGMKIYHVYGIYPVQDISEHIVTSLPVRFEEHPDYSPIHESQKDCIVFDSAWTRFNDGFSSKDFADSWNIGENNYNSNYLFATLEDAEKAHALFTKFYEEDDAARNREIERHAEIDRLADMMFRYHDDHDEYEYDRYGDDD